MNTPLRIVRSSALLTIVLLAAPSTADAQTDTYERPPIDYHKASVDDRITQLSAKLESGELQLHFDHQHGYLASVLEALDIPVSSQTLVFSKTSLQRTRIAPRTPRALYFNDDVYVGWCVRGDVLEIAATDPRQGATFYTLEQTKSKPPKFVRDRGQCLSCHASSRTQYVPGYLVRSVYPDSDGQPILGSGTFTTDQTSPMEERWGGWYVTGSHGAMRHMGNMVFSEAESAQPELDRGANLQTLDTLLSTNRYLSPHSDIVALMVLEHQTQMHNAIAAANYETRQALHQSFQMNKFLEREEGHISESAHRRIEASADRVLRYLLMRDEFELSDQVSGSSTFANDFTARGIKDSKGRSLRDLDLKQRLFRYPCSFLIYSSAFDGLPDEVRTRVLDKLVAILQGTVESPDDAHLTAEMRQQILEILRDTKPEFAIRLPS
ncbi:hypothetical protein Poly24_38320 [Rosistilla carotiformis]|uniref:Cytochrome c domain-containing protein n=1 Tax=Rosistilla carotiformis TaxID=2528017 RepID=A0A518JX51_9BACT|nr:hypothetical protein [Rosistilla carotiformis]QDV70113.1 hypothetical protein Poly24_38320 [Rosistilla carotiformis]